MKNKTPTSLVLFASGTGSNVLNIIQYFKSKPEINVSAVFCNNKNAKVIEKSKKENIDVFVFTKEELLEKDLVLEKLRDYSADFIVLAGFLLKIPHSIIHAYPNKILNIHPALLPKYGGKGMYGMHVHEAIVQNNEIESGITIHYVNQNYDEGAIVFQTKCPVSKNDSAEDVAAKIHDLEMKHFPKVIEETITTAKLI